MQHCLPVLRDDLHLVPPVSLCHACLRYFGRTHTIYYYKEIYIETERIIIRNFKQKDAEGLLEYLSNPRVNCFAGDRLCSEEAAWAYMQYSPKDMLRYAVSLKKMTYYR